MFRLASSQLVFCLLFLLPYLSTQNACTDFVDRLTLNKGNPIAQSSQEKEYFAFSGIKGRNDLGSKSDCEDSKARKYFIIAQILYAAPAVNTKGWSEYETGVCLPDYCHFEQLEGEDSVLMQLCQVNDWNPSEPVILYDPNGTPPRGGAYYVFVTIFYMLLALCIVSTFEMNKHKCFKRFRKEDKKSGFAHKVQWLCKSFDAVANTKTLYKTAKESGQSDHISTFGFLRICSMLWVVSYHTKIMSADFYVNFGNPDTTGFGFKFVDAGDLSPGYFFFMGGFLAAFTLTGKAAREGVSIRKFFSDLMHRFIKIYPGAIVALLFYWIVMPGMMNGTLWNRYLGKLPVCGERWTQKFFLYDNFKIQPFDWCTSWTWYVAVDFHVYPVIILLCYLFVIKKNSKYIAYGLTVILTAVSMVIGMEIIKDYEDVPGNIKFQWYGNSPARANELFVGVLFGFQYYEYSKLKQKKYNLIYYCERYWIVRYICMIIGVFLNYFGIFFSFNSSIETGREWHYLRRLPIVVGTGLFFMPIANNCRDIFKWFLNLRIFQVFGKLCWGVYLLHWPFIHSINYRTHNIPEEYSTTRIWRTTDKVIVFAFIAAFVYHLLIEKPLLNIENHFTKRNTRNAIVKPPAANTAPSSPEFALVSPELPVGKDDEIKRPDPVDCTVDPTSPLPDQNLGEQEKLYHQVIETEGNIVKDKEELSPQKIETP